MPGVNVRASASRSQSFDAPHVFSAYLHALHWNLVHAADAATLTALRAGRKAVRRLRESNNSDSGPGYRRDPSADLSTGINRDSSHAYCGSTLKYRPAFPDRFVSIQDACSHIKEFILWYNESHRHSGISMLTPSMLHH